MKDKKFKIREGQLAEAVSLSQNIPEFDNPHDLSVYEQRLSGKKYLVAIAEVDRKPVGFKVGYDKFDNKSFYTWMGGVLPKYRKQGIAKLLAEYQERFASANGFDSVVLKTRNRHKNMLHFAISSGFQIIEVEQRDDVSENRILLKKALDE